MDSSPPRFALWVGVTLLILALAPARVAAAPASCAAPFSHEENLTDLLWDTDWVPKNEKIQVRLIFTAKAGIHASLPADAQLERPGALSYAGRQGQGELSMGLFSFLVARYRITDLSWQGISLDHEGDLPVPASFHNTLNNIYGDKASFTPLILPGATPRPVEVSLSGPKATLLTLSISVINIGIAKVSIKVPIAVQPILYCKLAGQRIDTLPNGATTSPLVHDSEGKAVSWPHDAALTQTGSATYHAQRELQIDLAVYPSIEVQAKAKIGPFEEKKTWTVAEFELTQKLASLTGDWTFDAVPLSWTFAPEVTPGDGGTTQDGGVLPPKGDGAIEPGPGNDATTLGDGDPQNPAQGVTLQGGCCGVAGAHSSFGDGLLYGLLALLFWGLRRRRMQP